MNWGFFAAMSGYGLVVAGLAFASGYHKGRDKELNRWLSRIFGLDEALERTRDGLCATDAGALDAVQEVLMEWAGDGEVEFLSGQKQEDP